jgi:ribosomal protein S18 acetylase RimI-like enzyme
MRDVFGAAYVSLHVRKTNRAALALYTETLGFTVQGIEKSYCPCLSFIGVSTDESAQTQTARMYVLIANIRPLLMRSQAYAMKQLLSAT